MISRLLRKYIHAALVLYWIVLLTATSIPMDAVKVPGDVDKIEHFGAYLVLTLLMYFSFRIQKKYVRLKKYAGRITFITASVYGILDEVHQLFIPGRFYDIYDILADIAGVLIGLGLIELIKRKTGLFEKLGISDKITDVDKTGIRTENR